MMHQLMLSIWDTPNTVWVRLGQQYPKKPKRVNEQFLRLNMVPNDCFLHILFSKKKYIPIHQPQPLYHL